MWWWTFSVIILSFAIGTTYSESRSVIKKTFYADGSKEFTIVKNIKRNECTCSCKCIPDNLLKRERADVIVDAAAEPTAKFTQREEEIKTIRKSEVKTEKPSTTSSTIREDNVHNTDTTENELKQQTFNESKDKETDDKVTDEPLENLYDAENLLYATSTLSVKTGEIEEGSGLDDAVLKNDFPAKSGNKGLSEEDKKDKVLNSENNSEAAIVSDTTYSQAVNDYTQSDKVNLEESDIRESLRSTDQAATTETIINISQGNVTDAVTVSADFRKDSSINFSNDVATMKQPFEKTNFAIKKPAKSETILQSNEDAKVVRFEEIVTTAENTTSFANNEARNATTQADDLHSSNAVTPTEMPLTKANTDGVTTTLTNQSGKEKKESEIETSELNITTPSIDNTTITTIITVMQEESSTYAVPVEVTFSENQTTINTKMERNISNGNVRTGNDFLESSYAFITDNAEDESSIATTAKARTNGSNIENVFNGTNIIEAESVKASSKQTTASSTLYATETGHNINASIDELPREHIPNTKFYESESTATPEDELTARLPQKHEQNNVSELISTAKPASDALMVKFLSETAAQDKVKEVPKETAKAEERLAVNSSLKEFSSVEQKIEKGKEENNKMESQESTEIVAEFDPNDPTEKIRQGWRKALEELRRRLRAHLEKRKHLNLNKKKHNGHSNTGVLTQENKDADVEEQEGHRYVIQVVRSVIKEHGGKQKNEKTETTNVQSTSTKASTRTVTEIPPITTIDMWLEHNFSTIMNTNGSNINSSEETVTVELTAQENSTTAAYNNKKSDVSTTATSEVTTAEPLLTTENETNNITSVSNNTNDEKDFVETTEGIKSNETHDNQKTTGSAAVEGRSSVFKEKENEILNTVTPSEIYSTLTVAETDNLTQDLLNLTTVSEKPLTQGRDDNETFSVTESTVLVSFSPPFDMTNAHDKESNTKDFQNVTVKTINVADTGTKNSTEKEDASHFENVTNPEREKEEKISVWKSSTESGNEKQKNKPEMALMVDENYETKGVTEPDLFSAETSKRLEPEKQREINSDNSRKSYMTLSMTEQLRKPFLKNISIDDKNSSDFTSLQTKVSAEKERLETARLLRAEQERIDRLHELQRSAGMKAEMERHEQINRQLEELSEVERHQREMIERQKMAQKEKQRTQRLKQLNSQIPHIDLSASESSELHTTDSSFVVEDETSTTGTATQKKASSVKQIDSQAKVHNSQCEAIRTFARIYEMQNPGEWVERNCAFARQYFQKTTCSQLRQLFDSCF